MKLLVASPSSSLSLFDCHMKAVTCGVLVGLQNWRADVVCVCGDSNERNADETVWAESLMGEASRNDPLIGMSRPPRSLNVSSKLSCRKTGYKRMLTLNLIVNIWHIIYTPPVLHSYCMIVSSQKHFSMSEQHLSDSQGK